MYYLDTFGLHRPTTLAERRLARKTLNRDEVMEYKLKLQRNQCFYCCVPIDMASHLDHVVPVYYGGRNTLNNLVASCRDCNMEKGTGQIEITNPYTIKDYQKLIAAKAGYDAKCARLKLTNTKRYHKLRQNQPKRVGLYHVFRADRFREV